MADHPNVRANARDQIFARTRIKEYYGGSSERPSKHSDSICSDYLLVTRFSESVNFARIRDQANLLESRAFASGWKPEVTWELSGYKQGVGPNLITTGGGLYLFFYFFIFSRRGFTPVYYLGRDR